MADEMAARILAAAAVKAVRAWATLASELAALVEVAVETWVSQIKPPTPGGCTIPEPPAPIPAHDPVPVPAPAVPVPAPNVPEPAVVLPTKPEPRPPSVSEMQQRVWVLLKHLCGNDDRKAIAALTDLTGLPQITALLTDEMMQLGPALRAASDGAAKYIPSATGVRSMIIDHGGGTMWAGPEPKKEPAAVVPAAAHDGAEGDLF